MKKFLLSGLFVLTVAIAVTPDLVWAEGPTVPSAIKRIQERVQNLTGQRVSEPTKSAEERRTAIQQTKANALRNAVEVRYEVLSRALGRIEGLVDKIQVRVDSAKAEGKDTTKAVAALEEVKSQLADAKSNLDLIKTEKNNASTKEDFIKIQTQFRTTQKDLNAIKLQLAKAISAIKSFNSVKTSEIPSTREVTRSATATGAAARR